MGTASTEALALLARGAITLKGRMPWSTNVTLLVELALDGVTAPAVYKPARGERALWDFPPGLRKRELAAARVWATDNGLCFQVERKLRTVTWDFGGAPIPLPLLEHLRRLVRGGLPA